MIGTNNKYKLAQFKRSLAMIDPDMEILSLAELEITYDVEEDGDNLLHNAEKKAREYAEMSGLVTMADDTGLFIDALDGEPGIHAKRWAEGTDRDRCLKIIERLENVPHDQRTAKYIGVVSCYDPIKKRFYNSETDVEGFITDELKGENGFGYDPIFYVTKFGKRFAELTNDEIDSISHRTNGAKKVLNEYLDESK